jgi:hypothetical protein
VVGFGWFWLVVGLDGWSFFVGFGWLDLVGLVGRF